MDDVLLFLKSLSLLGPVGLILAGLLAWIYKLYGKISNCEQERIQDAKNYTELALKLQERVYEQIKTIAAMVEIIKDRANK